jgi:hypothetical protein
MRIGDHPFTAISVALVVVDHKHDETITSTLAETLNERQRLRRRQHCPPVGTAHEWTGGRPRCPDRHDQDRARIIRVVAQFDQSDEALTVKTHLRHCSWRVDASVPDDVAFAELHIRAEMIATKTFYTILHVDEWVFVMEWMTQYSPNRVEGRGLCRNDCRQ